MWVLNDQDVTYCAVRLCSASWWTVLQKRWSEEKGRKGWPLIWCKPREQWILWEIWRLFRWMPGGQSWSSNQINMCCTWSWWNCRVLKSMTMVHSSDAWECKCTASISKQPAFVQASNGVLPKPPLNYVWDYPIFYPKIGCLYIYTTSRPSCYSFVF